MNRVVVLFLLALLAIPAHAAPLLESADECGLYADMAVMDRALAEEGIPIARARKLNLRVYAPGDERALSIGELVLQAAYRTQLGPRDFAMRLLKECVGTNGNVDAILGTSS
jgi:hypothetical protein